MPDWSYHSLFKPVLFRLPPEQARKLTLSAIGLLGRLPFGSGLKLIDWMGHMAPPAALQNRLGKLELSSPVGLSDAVDPLLLGTESFTRFGFGFIMLGAVAPEIGGPDDGTELRKVWQDREREALCYNRRTERSDTGTLLNRLSRLPAKHAEQPKRGLTWLAETAREGQRAEDCKLVLRLSRHIDFWTVDACGPDGKINEPALREAVAVLKQAAPDQPWLLHLYLDTPAEETARLRDWAKQQGAAGIWLDDTAEEGAGTYVSGRCNLERLINKVRQLTVTGEEGLPVAVSGAATEPEEGRLLLQAGASWLALHSGMVYSGPGLPKRINEMLAQDADQQGHLLQRPNGDSAENGWFRAFINSLRSGWGFIMLLGVGMLIGGQLAWLIAATTIVLPYDLQYIGMTRPELELVNDRLLPFMMHDRLTLAGTMMAIGILYIGLARFGMRRGLHYARQTVLASAAPGFLSFFLFLGFEYFDPLHALVSALLFPFFILGIAMHRKYRFHVPPVNRHNDSRWREGLRGQLAFVILGFSLIIGGIIISLIGMGSVFVPEDLLYLCTTSEELAQQNERLISLVAHDRAGFGGALLSLGIGVLLLSLWGYRQGESWIWWTLAISGMCGLFTGFGVHIAIGYVNQWHLFPAYIVLLLYIFGLKYSYRYLHARPASAYEQPGNFTG